MANTILTAEIIADQALATLYETTVVAQLAHRDYEGEFARKVGDAISIRKPIVFQAKEYVRANGIDVQDASEGSIPMTLNHFADVSFAVTSEELTLKIDDFDATFLTPAMEAMVQKVDRDLIAQLYADVTAEVGAAAYAQEDTNVPDGRFNYADSRVLIEAGKVLTRKNVPTTQRSVVVGPDIAAAWKAEKTWRQADKRGGTEGLTEAALGPRVSGFTPYETQNVPAPKDPAAQVPGDPTTEVGIAFHRSALALATRPLALPKGAQMAAVRSYKGLSVRVVYDYDMDTKQDVISVDMLYGTKVIDPNRAVLIKGADKV